MSAVQAYDELTCELRRIEALLDLVIGQLNNGPTDYGWQVALECGRAKLAIVHQHADKLLATVESAEGHGATRGRGARERSEARVS